MPKNREIYRLHAELCKMLSNPTRLEILNMLRDGEKTVGELVTATGLRQANLSQHLATMRQRGVVLARREGAKVYYKIANQKIVRACELIREVLHEQLAEGEKLIKGSVAVVEDERLKSILNYKTIAVVGLSRDSTKDSHRVAAYLRDHSYHIIPINPFADEILGERCYPSLIDIPEELRRTIEVVDIFRPSEDVPPIVKQAIQLKRRYGGPHAVWMQLGITNELAAERARKAGMEVVMDRCMMIEHRRLGMGKR